MKNRVFALSTTLIAALAVACGGAPSDAEGGQGSEVAEQDVSRSVRIARTDLVSDGPGAVTKDANLVNAWGIAFNPAGPAWVSNNGSHTTTVYDAAGKLLLTVAVPAAPGDADGSAPTGQVFNGLATAFAGDKFILANEHGTIVGWQPSGGAKTRADRTSGGSVYKGLAIAGARTFAADFHNGAIDVFDATYGLVSTNGFVDASIPAGYAPFNIQELGGKLYVTYAEQKADHHDDQAGPGKGFVNVFDTSGTLIGRVASRGTLNSPWGLALAPASLGPKLAGKLLVGNFGDGAVQAFDVAFTTTGGGHGYAPAPKTTVHASYRGSLLGTTGQKLAIEGLWALAVSPQGTLFFSAGPGGEAHGVFGKLALAH